MAKDDQRVNLNVTTSKDGVLTILHGTAKAPDPNSKSLNINGTLTAPFNYYAGRKDVIDALKHQSHILVDADNKKISLFINDKSGIDPDSIIGTLTDGEHISEWKINTLATWTVRDFIKFIRPKRFMFANGEQQSALIKELLEWHVKIEKEVKDFSDNRGNSLSSLETRITQIKLMDSFQLNVPVFTGYGKKVFNVMIGVEATSNGVVLNLFSDDLAEMRYQLVDEYIERELAKFDDAGFDCSRIFI